MEARQVLHFVPSGKFHWVSAGGGEEVCGGETRAKCAKHVEEASTGLGEFQRIYCRCGVLCVCWKTAGGWRNKKRLLVFYLHMKLHVCATSFCCLEEHRMWAGVQWALPAGSEANNIGQYWQLGYKWFKGRVVWQLCSILGNICWCDLEEHNLEAQHGSGGFLLLGCCCESETSWPCGWVCVARSRAVTCNCWLQFQGVLCLFHAQSLMLLSWRIIGPNGELWTPTGLKKKKGGDHICSDGDLRRLSCWKM